MNRTEYIATLVSYLGGLPPTEIKKVVEYYTEYFNEACISNETDEAIIKRLGSPEEVAGKILKDFSPMHKKKNKTLFPIVVACTCILFILIGGFAVVAMVSVSANVSSSTQTATVESYYDTAVTVSENEISDSSSFQITIPNVESVVGSAVESAMESAAEGLKAASDNINYGENITWNFSDINLSYEIENYDVSLAEKVEMVVSVLDEVENIKLHFVYDNIEVVRSNKDKITLTYYNRFLDDYKIEYSSDSKTFSIEPSEGFNYLSQKYNKYISGRTNGITSPETVILEIPYGRDIDGLHLSTVNGSILVTDMDIRDVEISTVNGEVCINGGSGKSIEASMVNGSCTVEYANFESISISSVNGSGTIMGISPDDYQFNVSYVNGSVYVDDEHYNRNRLEDLKRQGTGNSKEVNYSCVNGTLYIYTK